MTSPRAVGALTMAIAATALLFGCGGGGSGRAERTSAAQRAYERGVKIGAIVPPEAGAEPKPRSSFHHPGCMRGRIFLGDRPGVVGYEATCFASRKGGRIYFRVIPGRLLWRVPGAKGGILSFRAHPDVRGPGAVSPHGTCRLEALTLPCEAAARGQVRIHGSVERDPRRACASAVDLVEEIPERCRGRELCGLLGSVRTFAAGRPEGC